MASYYTAAQTPSYSPYPAHPSYPSYPSYSTHQVPFAGPSKHAHQTSAPTYAYPQPAPYTRHSTSPPERAESVTTGGGTFSAAGSSYAGSETDSTGVAGIDLLDYMDDRLSSTIDPMPLDRSLARQAQTSGEMNAKTRELLALQQLAKRRLATSRANFADGIKAAKEVHRDLEWSQKRVAVLNQRAAQKYPTQYRAASAKYPAPIDY